MILTVPVTADGRVDARFGKATTMAVAKVEDGELTDWQAHEVGWDVLHDQSEHGQHHDARQYTVMVVGQDEVQRHQREYDSSVEENGPVHPADHRAVVPNRPCGRKTSTSATSGISETRAR